MVGMEEGHLCPTSGRSPTPTPIADRRRAAPVLRGRDPRPAPPDPDPGAEPPQRWGKPRATIPSRFLYELTGQADNPNYLAAKRQKLPSSGKAGAKAKTNGKAADKAKGKPKR